MPKIDELKTRYKEKRELLYGAYMEQDKDKISRLEDEINALVSQMENFCISSGKDLKQLKIFYREVDEMISDYFPT